MCICTGNGNGRGGSKNDEPIGWDPYSTWTPPPPPLLPQLSSTISGTFGGDITQVLGRPVGQSRGRPARQWLDPTGSGRSVEVHVL